MSSTAPWLPLAVDWHESEMWDELPEHGINDKATDGERLAWICLLCEAKIKGRAGKVTIRKNAFQNTYRLSERSVDGMLKRAQKCGAADSNGNSITLCNWRVYQQKMGGSKTHDLQETPETPETPKKPPTTTHHTSHITHHNPLPPVATPNGSQEPAELPPVTWESVVVVLKNEGMGGAQQAVEAAKENNNLPSEVLFTVNHWRANKPAWDIGTLYNKICGMRDGRPNSPWPPIDPAIARDNARADLERSQKKTAKMAKESAVTRAENNRAREARREKYGPVLDAMDPDECAALIEKLKLGNAPADLQRDQLLFELERQAVNR